eukprot:3652865-Pyramimonas_sp.AAC.1
MDELSGSGSLAEGVITLTSIEKERTLSPQSPSPGKADHVADVLVDVSHAIRSHLDVAQVADVRNRAVIKVRIHRQLRAIHEEE